MLDPTSPTGFAPRAAESPQDDASFDGERGDAEDVILHLAYGFPGNPLDSPIGRDLLIRVLAQMGLNALTDEAAKQLAGLHLQRQAQERVRHG